MTKVRCAGLVALLLLTVAAWLAYAINPLGWQDPDNVALGLASNLTASLIVIGSVDLALQAGSDRERRRRRSIAIKHLRFPLTGHFQTLFNMYKASSTAAPNTIEADPGRLLSTNFVQSVEHLDVFKPAPIFPKQLWVHYLAGEFQRFKDHLFETINLHGAALEPALVDLLEQIATSTLTGIVLALPQIHAIWTGPPLPGQTAAPPTTLCPFTDSNYDGTRSDMVTKHVGMVAQLIACYNQMAAIDAQIKVTEQMWGPSQEPQVGSSRV